jgi:GNAT superfamily N-acetyltransferase
MTDNEFTIRRATLDDAAALAVLFDAYRQFYEQETDHLRAEQFLSDRILNDESVIFVAEDRGGELLGFTQLYPLFSSVGMSRLWLLNDLFVAESARCLGVAAALLNRAQDFGRQDAASGLLLETHATNSAARALYEKQGWTLNETTVYYTFAC